MAEHTKGRLRESENLKTAVIAESGRYVGNTDTDDLARFDKDRANALRWIAVWNACEHFADPEATVAALVAALQECEAYFEDRADAEYFTDSPQPVGNTEMSMLGVVRAALEGCDK